MPKFIEFNTPNGEILIAIHADEDGIRPVSSPGEIIEKAEASLDQVFSRMSSIVHALADALTHVKESISSAEVAFGVQLKGKSKLCIVEGEAMAAIKVKIVFKPS